MKSRFREYRQRLVQNQARKPVINADQPRDTHGRFARSRDLSIEAVAATERTGGRADDILPYSEQSGSITTHMALHDRHLSHANRHWRMSEQRQRGDAERRLHQLAAMAHSQARATHENAASRLVKVREPLTDITLPNPGFDLSDKTEALVYADWLEDHASDKRAAGIAADHLRKYYS